MANRVSLRDVAAACNRSLATVSRALAGAPEVSAATRLLIEDTAQRLGYRPDPALSALVTYRRSRTGPRTSGHQIVWLEAVRPASDDNYWTGIIDAARASADALGYGLQRIAWKDLGGPKAAGRVLRARGIAGIIAHQFPPQEPVDRFPWSDFCAVTYVQPFHDLRLHTVSDDTFRTAYDAFSHAVERGHRRVGLVTFGATESWQDIERLGAGLVHHRRGLEALPRLQVPSANADAVRLIAGWAASERPDAVICQTGFSLYALRESGIACPGAISVAALNRLVAPDGCSGFDPNPREIGAAFVRLLDGIIRRAERGHPPIPYRTLVPRIWVEGSTMPPRT